MVFYILFFALVALLVMDLLFLFSPQQWKEARRHQCQVVLLAYFAGITAVLFATGGPMFLSIAFAAMTLFFSAVFVVGGYVKRSRASGRTS
jgi:hypothetical protein